MEQSRGPNIPLVQAAGIDPAYVPGILAPEPDEDDRTEAAASETGSASDAAADVTTGAVPSPIATAEESAADTDDNDEGDEGDDGVTEGSDAGPVFEAADRRGAIRADRDGLAFRLDDTEAEFGWKEIGAVEVDVPKWGHRFGVTVYLSPRRWFGTWVDAPSRRQLRAWNAEFDAVLDVYFEADTEEQDSAESSTPGR